MMKNHCKFYKPNVKQYIHKIFYLQKSGKEKRIEEDEENAWNKQTWSVPEEICSGKIFARVRKASKNVVLPSFFLSSFILLHTALPLVNDAFIPFPTFISSIYQQQAGEYPTGG
jgi:hypothetical protein